MQTQNFNEADLRAAWKWTVALCLSYVMILAVCFGFIAYDLILALSVSDSAQATARCAEQGIGSTRFSGVRDRR